VRVTPGHQTVDPVFWSLLEWADIGTGSFCKIAGVSRMTVSRWKRGDRGDRVPPAYRVFLSMVAARHAQDLRVALNSPELQRAVGADMVVVLRAKALALEEVLRVQVEQNASEAAETLEAAEKLYKRWEGRKIRLPYRPTRRKSLTLPVQPVTPEQ
jgi:transcriptional regulator with XRE-family HTH domain